MYGSGYSCAYGLEKEQQEGLEMRVIFFSYFNDQKFNLWLHEKKSKLLIL